MEIIARIAARRRPLSAFCAGLAAAACLLLALPGTTRAQAAYPDKPIRVLVPFSAGALTDVIARIYAERVGQALGQSMIVENKPGAGGVVAAQQLLNAPADGYTIMFVSSSHAVNPSLQPKLPYDTRKDFAGIALVAASPTVVTVRPGLKAESLQQLIDLARKSPGSLNFGSAGAGSATHLAGEYFAGEAGIRMTHIPYKGVQEAVAEAMAGRIDVTFPPIALVLPQVQAGKLRALAVTSPQRSPQMPDTPTVQELGLKDFDYSIWYAAVARAGTPPAVLQKLAAAMRKVGAMPDVQAQLGNQGLVTADLQLGAFDQYIDKEIDKLGRIVKATGAAAQ